MPEMHDSMQLWINDVLVWIGYGTVIGLLAKAIMPGRDPGGTVATLGMGVTGVVIGCGVWTFFAADGVRLEPISWEGLMVGTAGALLILFFFRLLAGYWHPEMSDRVPLLRTRRRRRNRSRRYRLAEYYDD